MKGYAIRTISIQNVNAAADNDYGEKWTIIRTNLKARW